MSGILMKLRTLNTFRDNMIINIFIVTQTKADIFSTFC